MRAVFGMLAVAVVGVAVCCGCGRVRSLVSPKAGEEQPSIWDVGAYTPPDFPLGTDLREHFHRAGGREDASDQLIWYWATRPESISWWGKKVKRNPQSPLAWAGRTGAALRAGRTNLALDATHRLMTLAPGLPYSYAARAMALNQSGQRRAAVQTLQAGLFSASGRSGTWLMIRLLLGSLSRARAHRAVAVEAVADRLVPIAQRGERAGGMVRAPVPRRDVALPRRLRGRRASRWRGTATRGERHVCAGLQRGGARLGGASLGGPERSAFAVRWKLPDRAHVWMPYGFSWPRRTPSE